MLNAIDFIKGSIATSDIAPIFKYVLIANGYVASSNGVTTAQYPVDLSIEATVNGHDFAKAVKVNNGEFKLKKIKNKIQVIGKTRVYLDTLDESFIVNHVANTKKIPIKKSFMEGIKKLLPFTCADGSLYWATGIQFIDNHMFACNGITLLRCATKTNLATRCIVHAGALQELLRIKETPTHISVSKDELTFHYASGALFTTKTLDTLWDNTLFKFLNKHDYTECKPVLDFFDVLKTVTPFLNDRAVYLRNGKLRTHPKKGNGAYTKIKTKVNAKFDAVQLMLLKDVATKINFGTYPENVPFIGKNIRGIIAGQF